MIAQALRFQPHALPLQLRQQRHLFGDPPNLLAAHHLLLGIGPPIAILSAVRACVGRQIGPMALVLATAIDPLVTRHAKDPRMHVLDQQTVPPSLKQAQECLLRDLFGLRVLASERAQVTEERLAQFVKPLLDFLP